MTTYRIKEFEAFIKRDALRKGTKARRLRLPWMSVPTDLQKRAVQRIAMHPRGAEIYGAFILMASVSARATEKVDMGILADDEGRPYTPEDLEEITGFPADSFAIAIEVLASPRVGWLEPVGGEVAGNLPAETRKLPADSREVAGRKADVAGNLPARSRFLPADGTGRDMTGQDRTAAAQPDETGGIETPEEPPTLTDRELIRPLAAFVRWKTGDEEGTADNIAELAGLVREHGAQAIHEAARLGSMRGDGKLWPNEVVEYLPGAAPRPLQEPPVTVAPETAQALAILDRLGYQATHDLLGYLPGKVPNDAALRNLVTKNLGTAIELIRVGGGSKPTETKP